MTAPRAVVVDTNVVVAGLLTRVPTSPTAAVLDAMLEARFVFLLSEALVAKYRVVLLRPAIAERHGLDARTVDDLLAEIVRNGIVREPASKERAPAAKDQHLWDLVAAESGSVLVAGDSELIQDPPAGTGVLSPRDLAETLNA